MQHLVHVYLAAGGGGDLFSMGQNLGTKLGALAGLFTILVVGVIALGHLSHGRGAALVLLLLLALIPIWLFFDPTQAGNTLKATASGLHH